MSDEDKEILQAAREYWWPHHYSRSRTTALAELDAGSEGKVTLEFDDLAQIVASERARARAEAEAAKMVRVRGGGLMRQLKPPKAIIAVTVLMAAAAAMRLPQLNRSSKRQMRPRAGFATRSAARRIASSRPACFRPKGRSIMLR